MDEAYQPFAARDSMARLKRHEHVLLDAHDEQVRVWQGVRIGYLIARRELIAEIDKLRPPFNISVSTARRRSSRSSTPPNTLARRRDPQRAREAAGAARAARRARRSRARPT
jgi:histidinol-phosphate/aromatic aminotransferase/cobyric acid decarboxylase-like protein